jgi:glycosyltransferase involved in cell wall biosynthesis
MRLTEVFVRKGHWVELVSIESSEEIAHRTFHLPVTALGKGIGRYGFNPKLVSWLRNHASNFDAVITHGLWNYSSVGSWLALRNHSTPYFIFSHGMMSPWFRDNFPLKHLKKQAFWWLAEGRVLRDARYVLFTSEEERALARNVFRGHSYREMVPGYGAADPGGDAEAQKSQFLERFNGLQNKRFLLFLGRIHPIKGCDNLIRGFAESISTIPRDLDLAIAGPDTHKLKCHLEKLAEKLEVARRIHWLGMLQGDLKWGALRAACALIHPSHHENFGIVVAEAMACSTPVLITDKVNIWREVMASGGGLVEPDTVEGSRRLISRFFAIPESEREQMKVAAREGFLRYFHVDTAAENILRLIRESKRSSI